MTLTDTRLLYDGWNLIAEVEYLGMEPYAPPATSAAPRPFLRRTYLWGQDLSDSLQGGGVVADDVGGVGIANDISALSGILKFLKELFLNNPAPVFP